MKKFLFISLALVIGIMSANANNAATGLQYSDDYHLENNSQQPRNNITISPNPASTEVDITIDLQNEKQSVSIMVMDISGQLLQKVVDAKDLSQGLKKYTINVTPLSIGIFFVVIKIDNTPYVYKILKQ